MIQIFDVSDLEATESSPLPSALEVHWISQIGPYILMKHANKILVKDS